ncbi:probable amidase At4g34880 isoform X1 [Abrus precatorius]|uniref:Probable amidase At4g34880 isoform X1 n=1 Tax=Abrus precatorius TaxID=3816 RepID=A0A8B8KGW7_ABRPR|nr:probable amidase At4g34880 isoform X1 [Abrus precatorius]
MASNSVRGFSFFQLPFLILLVTLLSLPPTTMGKVFSVEEATIYDLQHAFRTNQLTSRKLVEFYLKQIETQNPVLRGVLELNPDALAQADRADQERSAKAPGSFSALHGIPILLKDNIATKDKMNTTAGSYALLGSVVPRDAGVVTRLRKAGAIILGKASLSEWAHYRSNGAPSGWSARGGQGKNPYTLGDPCGSSSGSSISVAANLVAVSLGTETDGSILCPSDSNSVVGIKPTVGLTSRAGVVPITPRQDTVGPICRTVSDAALVLETIVGIDTNDKATIQASKYIPKGGYAQFLKKDGLRGKRLGVVRLFYNFGNDTFLRDTFKLHLETLRRRGAVLVDKLEIDNINEVLGSPSEGIAMAIEFKSSLNAYLRDLVTSPVRSLADVIDFNKKHPKLEKLEYGQDLMVEAQKTSGTELLNQALLNMTRLSQNGFEKLMEKNKLDALVVPFSIFSTILAIGGHPGVTVPAGYEKGMPFGICFAGLQGSEPKLIEIAYSFEQATVIRKPPPLRKLEV